MTTIIKNCLISLLLLAAAHAAAQEAETGKKGDASGSRYDGMAGIHKRLVDAINNMKIQPDEEGKCTFTISSGVFYDPVDRQQFIYRKTAKVYLAQNRINKVIFEYYQFGMDSKVREIKTFTNTSADSDDLSSLRIDYISNTGEKQSYTAGELSLWQSQREIVGQYANYLISLIYNIELNKHRAARLQFLQIERTIQLGD